MKLVRVRIQNYRSIVDSGTVYIEGRVTVLVGKNEQGKSNFLRGIESFNPEKRYLPKDLPNHLQPGLEGKNATEIPVVTLWFKLEPADHEDLKEIVENLSTGEELKCTKYYGNNYECWAVKPKGSEKALVLRTSDVTGYIVKISEAAATLGDQFEAHAIKFPPFANNREKFQQIIGRLVTLNAEQRDELIDVINSCCEDLQGLTKQDKAIKNDIGNAISTINTERVELEKTLSTQNYEPLLSQVALFVLHSATADKIPNEVGIETFVNDPEGISKGMANLCQAAGLSVAKIRELANIAEASQRQSYEDFHGNKISGDLNEFWRQESYYVHFQIEKDRLSVSIRDETYSPRIPPTERSDGFQWYLSFYSKLQKDASEGKRIIVLLDNPGLDLHLDGQQDIKRLLEKKISRSSQLIYATHSPGMIDPFNLIQIRKVEMRGQEIGTKVYNSVFEGDKRFDLLEPVRMAIGASLITSLVCNEFNVLVEGSADKAILDGAFCLSDEAAREKILVNGSLSESHGCDLVQFYKKNGLPFVALLDSDSGGRRLCRELKKCSVLDEQIVNLSDVFTNMGSEFELEDILSEDFYHRAVRNAYPDKDVQKLSTSTKKRTNAYEKMFRAEYEIGFSKRRVAEEVKKLLEQEDVDNETRGNLDELTSRILDRLWEQTSQRAPEVRTSKKPSKR